MTLYLERVGVQSYSDGVAKQNSYENVKAVPSKHSQQKVGKKYSKEDFEFLSKLGSGAYSTVYLTKFLPTGKKYAAKVIPKKLLLKENKIKTVKIEKEVLNNLNHPNIISLFCTFQDTENLYFVLELAPGGEMFHIISQNGPLTLEAAQFYIAELVQAMEYMHSKGIVHRDLKPENILLSRWMHTKITDFGTAKIENEEALGNTTIPGFSPRRKGTFCGTAEYVSPEILRDENVTMACDLWALGCILYQYLTGKHPFKADSEYLIFQKILNRELSFPDYFPLAAKDLCEKLLQLKPEDRLGYGGGGYERLKSHPFFNNIDWECLNSTIPPEIIKQVSSQDFSPLSPTTSFSSQTSESGPNSSNHSRINSYSSTLSAKSQVPSESQKSKLTGEDHSRWTPYLLRGESIILTGSIIKRRRLSAKKRQLILTNSPRLIYIDSSKQVIKGSIPFTGDMKMEKKSEKHFNIRTPGRTYVLECPKKDAEVWIRYITEMQNSALGSKK